jgi:hypothetical protein
MPDSAPPSPVSPSAESRTAEQSYKPAPLRRSVTVRVGGGEVSMHDVSGAQRWRLALSGVTALNYAESSFRGQISIHLDMTDRDGQRRRLAINGGQLGDRNVLAFVGLVRLVLAGIAADRPETPVALGFVGPGRLALFVLGVMMMLIGGMLATMAVVMGGEVASVVTGVIAGLGVAVVALRLVLPNRPWLAPPLLPLREFLSRNPGLALQADRPTAEPPPAG